MAFSLRCWDFTVSAPPSSSVEVYENPPGFEFVCEGLAKECEYVASLRQQQQQQQQAAAAAAVSGVCAASPRTPEAVALLQRKLWDCAIAPGKSFAMNLFMLYMGGGSGIFGVLILFYALHSCVKTLLAVSQQFQVFKSSQQLRFVWFYEGLYVSICLLFGVYILHQAAQVGALPLSSGDYLGIIPQTLVTSRAFTAENPKP